MENRSAARNAAKARRWIGAIVCLVLLGIIVAVIPRVSPRSPITIVVLCVLAVLTMKLVEHRVARWYKAWASRTTDPPLPPKGRP